MDDAPEVPADELLDRPSGQALTGLGQEREAPIRVDRPDEVWRVLDEVPVARLRVAEELVEPGVGHRDRGLVGEDLEPGDRLVVDLARGPERDRERADDLARRRTQRGDCASADAQACGDVLVVRLVRHSRVDEVVIGADRSAERGGEAVDAAIEGELEVEHPAARGVVDPGRDDRHEVGALLGHEREVRAVGAEEAARLVDDELEDLVGIADGGDACRDLAQRLLRVDAARELLLGAGELVDEPGVGDGDRRLRRERLDDRDVVVVERVRCGRQDAERAERAMLAGERHRQDRPDAGLLGRLPRGWRLHDLGIGQVVACHDRPVLEEDPAGNSLPRQQRLREPRLVGGCQPLRRIRPADLAGRLVEEVDPGAVCTDQPARLVDDALEDARRVVDCRDAHRDLAKGPLRVGPPRDARLRGFEGGDESGVRQGDGGLCDEGEEERLVAFAEGLWPRRPDGHGPERAVLADERRRDDGADPLGARVLVRPLRVREPLVTHVVAGPERGAGPEGDPGDADVRRAVLLAWPLVVGQLATRHVDTLEQAGLGVDEVEFRAVGVEQADSLVDGPPDDLVGLPERADPGPDLAEGPFGVGAALDVGA